MTKLTFLVAICLLGVGCANLNLQKPTAAITAMNLQGADANGFTMNFDVDIKNPNSIALPLSAADYKLGLAGVNVLQGNANPGGSVPGNGSKTVTLPVTVTYENLLAAEQGIVKSGGNVPYALDGGLSLDTGSPLAGKLRVPLQYSGTLPLRDILNNPQALLHNAAAQKLAKELVGGFLNR
jgi:LEA14-like dessication related protein